MARKFNPTGAQIALAAGAALIAGLAAKSALDKRKRRSNKKKDTGSSAPAAPTEAEIAGQLAGLVSAEPAPGTLYKIQEGDNLTKTVKAALRNAGLSDLADGTDQVAKDARVALMQCISSSEFNRKLYGKKDDFTSAFPAYTSPDDVSIRSAFLAGNADYLATLASGKIPTKKKGGRRGLIYIPSFRFDNQLQRLVCEGTEPPPLA